MRFLGVRNGSARWLAAAAACVLLAQGTPAFEGTFPTNFAEYGAPVSGFQDSFVGSTLDPAWTVVGTNVYSVSDGLLHIGAPSTDPGKLLYQGPPYDGITQNILMLGRVKSSAGTDCRMGATASNTTAGYGINLMFRGAETLDNVAFLDDYVVHGPQNSFQWQHNTWYWIRLLHSPNRTGGSDPAFNGSNDCFGKVWPADGTTAEPANYQFTWASNDARSGLAGIQSGVSYAASQWDVGYVLIQANGLPTITAGPPGPIPVPKAPTNLTAVYVEGTGVALNWDDESTDEDGFSVERSPQGHAFSQLASTGVGVTSHTDTLLYPATTYTYRVRAFNEQGNSEYSNEASITTSATQPRPVVPAAPSDLLATSLGPSAVALTWQDNSGDEIRFDLVRIEGGDEARSLAAPKPDVTSFADYSLHPGWPYTYRVRALSLQGPSAFSNDVGAPLTATLDVTLVSGQLTDSSKYAKDKIKVVAGYAVKPPATDPLDIVAHGLALQIGATNAPIAISILPGDKTWKVKKTKATWKSPKGDLPKVVIVVDSKKSRLTATVTSGEFDDAPRTTVRTLFASGIDGGAQTTTWVEKKAGVLKFVK